MKGKLKKMIDIILSKDKPKNKVKVSRFMSENPLYKNYEIGEMTYGFPKIYDYNDQTNLKIGKYCSFADNIQIFLGGEHHSDFVSTYPFTTFLKNGLDIRDKKSKGDVTIGNDVWVANNVTILSGVTIGDGAIIGAGSVVTKDVRDYEIVGGNPAKHIRDRFSEAQVKALKEIAWWHWTDEKISDNYQLIMSKDIKSFIKNHTD